jgi:lysylphosphatidylglycerol synthase-like protein
MMCAVAEHPRRAFNATGILTLIAGVVLFALVLWNVDAAEVWDGVKKLRWWLLVVIALGGLRFLMRAVAWSACIEPPHRLPVADAFKGVIAGDTIGNATPLGPVLGEPAKVAYARGRVPFSIVLTALAIENLFYSLSAAAMIAAGMLALLFAFNPPAQVRLAGEAAVGAILLLFVAAMLMVWRRPAILSRLLALVPGKSATRAEKVRALEHQIYTFASRRGGVVMLAVACELGFHALGVIEAYLTLTVINGAAPPLLSAFILETANRLFAVIFKPVPFLFGVGELSTAVVTEVLGFGGTTGVTVAVVRKARMAAWALVGVVLLARRRLDAKDPARRVQ